MQATSLERLLARAAPFTDGQGFGGGYVVLCPSRFRATGQALETGQRYKTADPRLVGNEGPGLAACSSTMKTYKNLWERIICFENLWLAARKARRGKGNRVDVARFEVGLEKNLFAIQKELINHSYLPGGYREFTVYERKPRVICAAPFRDRVVHHALCNIIEPIFDRTFIHDSYACRVGKGTHAAADRYTEFSRKNQFVLKLDIRQYFPSIDHAILYAQLSRRITDPEVCWLIRLILASKGDEGFLWTSGKGIPIGNLTSQFFANVYLSDFDHWLKESIGCRHYIRYVDDMVILSNNKPRLHSLVPPVKEKLASLGLDIHCKKSNSFPVSEGCDFMGYRIWPDHRRLRPDNSQGIYRRLKLLAAQYKAGTVNLQNVSASVASWVGHASHADTWGLRTLIFKDISFSQ